MDKPLLERPCVVCPCCHTYTEVELAMGDWIRHCVRCDMQCRLFFTDDYDAFWDFMRQPGPCRHPPSEWLPDLERDE